MEMKQKFTVFACKKVFSQVTVITRLAAGTPKLREPLGESHPILFLTIFEASAKKSVPPDTQLDTSDALLLSGGFIHCATVHKEPAPRRVHLVPGPYWRAMCATMTLHVT